jgi:hypothetical protein
MRITYEYIESKIKGETFLVLPNGRTTVCQLTLENGYTVEGYSACVDPSEFDLELGRLYAKEDAIEKIWPLEGYLLAETIYKTEYKTDESFPLTNLQILAMMKAGVWDDPHKRIHCINEYRNHLMREMVDAESKEPEEDPKPKKKLHWTQTTKGKKILAARKRSKK